jgi:hypothetical protein
LRINPPEIKMLSKTIRSMTILAAVLASCCASAQPGPAQAVATGCAAATSRIQPLAEHAGVQAEFARLSGTCLKELYLRCSRESSQGLLDFGEAALCSFGHEALLKGEFGGNFNALLAWWRVHRDDPLGK